MTVDLQNDKLQIEDQVFRRFDCLSDHKSQEDSGDSDSGDSDSDDSEDSASDSESQTKDHEEEPLHRNLTASDQEIADMLTPPRPKRNSKRKRVN